MSIRRGLGRGLAELIPAASPQQTGETVHELELGLIDVNPFQPRRDFNAEELAELAQSIKSQGLLQPVTVRPWQGRYQLVAGERRLRAVRDLGWTRIPALVREVDDRQLLELSLVENLLRADLNDIEVAEALASLQNQFGYTTTQLAEVIGKSRPAVSNTLRLLDLSPVVQQMVRKGALSAGHGRAILSFPLEQREELAETAAREGWSVRELERRSTEASGKPPVRRPRKRTAGIPTAPPALKRAESVLQERLATKVRLAEQRGVGTIAITYHGAEDLDRIMSLLLVGSNPL
jgi:ParB family transcriptional regulator, chromosome partitioning protein